MKRKTRRATLEKYNVRYKYDYYRYYDKVIDKLDEKNSTGNIVFDAVREIITINRQGKLNGCCL